MEADPDSGLIISLTPDVMRCLARTGFFEKLDGLLWPKDDSSQRERCAGDFKLSESVLLASGFVRTDVDQPGTLIGIVRNPHAGRLLWIWFDKPAKV